MNYQEKTKEIVSKIKAIEEKELGITLDIKTPTLIEFFKNNINGNYSLSNIKKTYYSWKGSTGYRDSKTNDICIYSKNYNLIRFFNKNISSFEHMISFTTLHEIRHFLKEKQNLSFEEIFYINYLSCYNGTDYFKYNLQYAEIDANLYASKRGMEIYKNNEKLKQEFEHSYNKHSFEKELYLIDNDLWDFCQGIKNNEDSFNRVKDDSLYKTYWHSDGNFKAINDIKNNENIKCYGNVTPLIITSYIYLNALKDVSLTDEELVFLSECTEIYFNILNTKIDNIKNIDNKRISLEGKNKIIKILEDCLNQKKTLINSIINKNYSKKTVK